MHDGMPNHDANAPSPRFRAIPFQRERLSSSTNAVGYETRLMHVFFVGDFRGTPDPHPIEDRKAIRVEASGVDCALALDYNRRRLGVKVKTLAQIDALPALTSSLWHGADWLARTSPLAGLELVHMTSDCVEAERADATSFDHSWVRCLFSDVNHIAMDPRHVVVLGFELDFSRDALLIEHIGRLAQRYAIPVLIPTSHGLAEEETPEVAAMRAAPWARWLTFVSGSFRTDAGVSVPATLLVARQIARRFGEGGIGPGLWGSLGEELLSAADAKTVARGWSRGVLALGPSGADITHDPTFSSASGTARSLSWLMLVQRFTHEARYLHYQHLGTMIPGGTGAAETAAFLDDRLHARYPKLDGLTFSLERAKWSRPPDDRSMLLYGSTLDLELRLVVHTPGGERIEHVEPLSWRFTC